MSEKEAKRQRKREKRRLKKEKEVIFGKMRPTNLSLLASLFQQSASAESFDPNLLNIIHQEDANEVGSNAQNYSFPEHLRPYFQLADGKVVREKKKRDKKRSSSERLDDREKEKKKSKKRRSSSEKKEKKKSKKKDKDRSANPVAVKQEVLL
eukprot:TRINITY_DN1600_c0_g2_i1.p1 TRINITY_DN1600_c0_g2~~TRINITY_DN1600_c0_g2_i1.p1  ORF type:complete len:152 (-),score=75.39 TRINITY_DN1600_c0_g2_i1:47-502(-)